MKKQRVRIPKWLRQRKPEPAPNAFRAWVEQIPMPTCCPFHREGNRRLLAAVRAPAGRCLLCGALSTWRARWPSMDTASPVPTPRRAHGSEEALGVYYDLCARCRHVSDTPAQVEALLRQRHRAPWN
jgi:hypothetical protein